MLRGVTVGRTFASTVDVTASQSQQQAVDSTGNALAQMEQVTQNIAACAEENASASEELRAQAATLRHVADAMRQLVG